MPVTLVNRYLMLRAAGLIPPVRVMGGKIDIACGEWGGQPWDAPRRVRLDQLVEIIGRIEAGQKWHVRMLEKTAMRVRIERPDRAPLLPEPRGYLPRYSLERR